MAEIGTAIAIIQIADRVIGLCKYWIEAIRSAPADLRSIFLETSALRTILSNLDFLSGHNGIPSSAINELSRAGGAVEHCHIILTSLENLLPTPVAGAVSGEASTSTKEKTSMMLARLAWPLKATKAKKLCDELVRYKTAINLALTIESAQDIRNIKAKTSEISQKLTDVQCREVYRWLQHTDPSPIHNRATSLIETGTCDWMQRMPEWSEWLAAKHRCLWIHGIPGAGKTILASSLIEKLKTAHIAFVVYYYCYFVHDQEEASPFLRWLIIQLCRRSKDVPARLYALFEQGCEPSLPELLSSAADCLINFDTVYVVVDAIDESKPRDILLKVLRDLITDHRFGKVQLLVTSREYLDIERSLEYIANPVPMSNAVIAEDIRQYVRSALKKSSKFACWPQQLLIETEQVLSTGAQGMFRWAACQLDRLKRLDSKPAVIRKCLATLPKTLDETYERIFLEIPEEEQSAVQQCLRWVNFHNKLFNDSIPFNILLQAIEAKEHNAKQEDNSTTYLNKERLREMCGCLIHISQGQGFKIYCRGGVKPKTQVVSFAHYTVKEFLESDRISKSSAAYFTLHGDNVHHDNWKSIMVAALDFRQPTIFNDYNDGDNDTENDDDSDYESDNLSNYKSNENVTIATFLELTSNFHNYCIISALFGITSCSAEAFSKPEEKDAVFKLLDPSGQYTQPAMELATRFQTYLGLLLENNHLLGELDFWTLEWHTEPGPTTSNSMLLLLALMMDGTKCLELASLLLEKVGPIRDLVHVPLSFTISVSWNGSRRLYPFKGSTVDFFAHMVGSGCYVHNCLQFMLNHQVTLHEPSMLLQSYIGGSEDNDYILSRLLELGADPNGAQYTATPLQIAVALGNYAAAEALLRAGADPNILGNPDGTRGYAIRILQDSEILFQATNLLENLSALAICQDGSVEIGDDLMDEDERLKIKALLIRHGAHAFTADQARAHLVTRSMSSPNPQPNAIMDARSHLLIPNPMPEPHRPRSELQADSVDAASMIVSKRRASMMDLESDSVAPKRRSSHEP